MKQTTKELVWQNFTIKCKIYHPDSFNSYYIEPSLKKSLPIYHPGQSLPIRMLVPHTSDYLYDLLPISSPPNSDYYCIHTKLHKESALEHFLNGYVEEGFEIEAGLPKGDFKLIANRRPKIWITEPCGQPAAWSMLQSIILDEMATESLLWMSSCYGFEEELFINKIKFLQNNYPKLKTHTFLKNAQCNINTLDFLEREIICLKEYIALEDEAADLYIAGSGNWTKQIVNLIKKEQIPCASCSIHEL